MIKGRKLQTESKPLKLLNRQGSCLMFVCLLNMVRVIEYPPLIEYHIVISGSNAIPSRSLLGTKKNWSSFSYNGLHYLILCLRKLWIVGWNTRMRTFSWRNKSSIACSSDTCVTKCNIVSYMNRHVSLLINKQPQLVTGSSMWVMWSLTINGNNHNGVTIWVGLLCWFLSLV